MASSYKHNTLKNSLTQKVELKETVGTRIT